MNPCLARHRGVALFVQYRTQVLHLLFQQMQQVNVQKSLALAPTETTSSLLVPSHMEDLVTLLLLPAVWKSIVVKALCELLWMEVWRSSRALGCRTIRNW